MLYGLQHIVIQQLLSVHHRSLIFPSSPKAQLSKQYYYYKGSNNGRKYKMLSGTKYYLYPARKEADYVSLWAAKRIRLSVKFQYLL